MTDDEILQLYKELKEHYGDKLVNFEHHPRQFHWQAITFQYYKEQQTPC